MSPASDALHHAIFCVDVEGFGARSRIRPDQGKVRAGLYEALHEAFAAAGVPWRKCHSEDRGDGVLILIPSTVPKSRLTRPLPRALARELVKYNEACSSPQARFRLRAVVHAGELIRDRKGVYGDALNKAYRLLDADGLKSALRDSKDATLAMIASEQIYEDVVRHDPANKPDAFNQISVQVKETRTTGWIWLPDPFGPDKGLRRWLRRRVAALARYWSRLLSQWWLRWRRRSGRPKDVTTLIVLTIQAAGILLIAAGEIPPPQCQVTPAQIRVLASTEMERVIRSVVLEFEKYSRGADGCRRANLRVDSVPYRGGAAEAISQGWLKKQKSDDVSHEADVWLPDSSLEVEQVQEALRENGIGDVWLDVSKGSFAKSPLVVAVPQPMAKELGLSDMTFSWRDAIYWPEWKSGSPAGNGEQGFFFGRASPRTSGVGLVATVALYQAALDRGVSDMLDTKALNEAGVSPQLHRIEHAIAQSDDEPMKLLCTMREAPPDSDLRRTALLVSEKSVADYRKGEPLGGRCNAKSPSTAPELIPLYAEHGTPVLDHPFVVIRRTAPPQSPARRRIIDEFFDYLKEPEAQKQLRAAGYRDVTGSADDSVFVDRPDMISLAGTVQYDPLFEAWDRARRSGKVLFVVDVSRAMAAPFPYVGGTRLAAAVEAIDRSRRLIGTRDQIGLWEFARRLDHGRDHRSLLPLGLPEQPHLDQMGTRLKELQWKDSEAGLYSTIRSAVTHMRGLAAGGDSANDPTKAVIVITNGTDTSPSTLSVTDLANYMESGKQIRLFVLAFRAKSCEDELNKITRNSGGACYQVDSMTTMSQALDGIAAGLWGNPPPR